MKVLVYGAGVIGSYLAHVLCEGKNDVTVLARGRWREHLENSGLRIHHHLQKKDTVDRPKVIGSISEAGEYDAVFAVMPYDKMDIILDDLAALAAPVVILVGNNMSAGDMQARILEKTVCPKTVLFAFQSTAGKRDFDTGILTCERAGSGNMDIGGLDFMPGKALRDKLESAFMGTGYKLRWQSDMDAFLVCHLAAVMPLGYITYANGGSMLPSTRKQRKLVVKATREAFDMLQSLGYDIVPEGDDKYYKPGIKRGVMKFVYFLMSKTVMGDLIACAHCRNAYSEMKLLDRKFSEVIARAKGFPMPNWDKLKALVPPEDELDRIYLRQREVRK